MRASVCVGSDEKDAECSVFVYVINRVSLCFCSVYILLTLMLFYCALRAHARCKCLINTILHYDTSF